MMPLSQCNVSLSSPQSHQRKEPRIEEHIGLSHIHAGNQLSDIGTVISSDFCSRLQDITLQHTVQVNWEQLHALREDQLEGVIKIKSIIMRNPSQMQTFVPTSPPPTCLPTCPAEEGLAQFFL